MSLPDLAALPRILLVDPDAASRRVLVEVLHSGGYTVVGEADAPRAMAVLRREGADAIVSALNLPGGEGEALLAHARAAAFGVPTVVLAREETVDGAVAALRGGAVEYLAPPFGAPELLAAVHGALARAPRPPPPRTGAPAPAVGSHLEGMIGRSQPMLELYEQIGRVARSTAPVLITGETGTGKELVARAVHRASGRGRFVAVNCAALPPHLLESELFGHERGAFTGAERARAGLFVEADGGTFFLDEVAELPLALQVKLLRVLQERAVRPLGGGMERPVDVRVLAATHRDLRAEIEAHAFRRDLFFRLHVLHLHVPALRERRADVPLLTERLLAQLAVREGWTEPKRVAPAALAALVEYSWPGNVRELHNVVERAAILGVGAEIDLDDLPDEVRGAGYAVAAAHVASERRLTLAQLEREYVLEVLRQTGGNRTLAAEWLGLPRRTLYRRLTEYGVLARD